MSQSDDASTARLDPSLIAITRSSPRCISTTVWVTGPPSNTRAAPCVRLVSPEVTAASWSTRSAGNPFEHAGAGAAPTRGNPVRERQRKAISRNDNRVGYGRHPLNKVRDQPVQVLDRT